METNPNKMDMLHGGLFWKLVIFALPLAATSILQHLFNSADVAVVGRFAGGDALAAVGANVANVGVFVNFIVGASIGPNVVVATMLGSGRTKEVSSAIHTIVATAVVGGLLLMLAGLVIARPLIEAIGTPAEVLDMAVLYFRLYMLGVPFIMIYNFGAAILRSIGDTKRPLIYMLCSGGLNVVLNLIFVIGFHLSVAGVALATSISNLFSAAMVMRTLMHEEGPLKLQLRDIRIHPRYLKRILQVGIPAGIQDSVFSVSNIFVQAGVNSFGAQAIAGAAAGLNFEYFTYDICEAFAQAAVTFYSQNLGAGQQDRCNRVFHITLGQAFLFTQLLALPFTIWANAFAGLYTTDPTAIDFAVRRMYHVMAIEGLCSIFVVPSGVLRSLGHAIWPSIITILGTVVFRILWIMTVFRWIPSYDMLMSVYPVSWILTGAALLAMYFGVKRRRFE